MVVIHGSAISSGLLLADSQPVASDNPTATLWVTCRHEKICICNTRSCKSIFVIYSPLTSVNTNYRVSKFNWKCLCWFRITISPLWLESNGNPMSWIITAASKKRTWILVFSFQSPNFSSKCWSTCRLWHLQNRVHGIWKRYWENNRRNRSSPLLLCFTDCNYRISKITIRMDTSIGIVPFFNPCWFPIMTRRNVFSMFGKANSIYLWCC